MFLESYSKGVIVLSFGATHCVKLPQSVIELTEAN